MCQLASHVPRRLNYKLHILEIGDGVKILPGKPSPEDYNTSWSNLTHLVNFCCKWK